MPKARQRTTEATRNACGNRSITDRVLARALHVALSGSRQQLLDCVQLAFRVFREDDARLSLAPQPV